MSRLPHPIGARVAGAAMSIVLFVAGCGPGGPASPDPAQPSSAAGASGALTDRLATIDDAVDRWRGAADLATAKRAAEEARNLVVGPAGPHYGDADGDGTIQGASEIGLLPGFAGEAALATEAAGACVMRDVLGGSWADPAERWAILDRAIAGCSEATNTFPSLPSHPQRIVGWATLALAADNLATAKEYGGHAHLHIDIATQAVSDCTG
jgi:hypothetical protein